MEETIFKYMDFDNFINILSTNQLWFSRLGVMEDATEGEYKDYNSQVKVCEGGKYYKKMKKGSNEAKIQQKKN